MLTLDQRILSLSLTQSSLPSRSLLLLSVSITACANEQREIYVEMVYDFVPSALRDDEDAGGNAGGATMIGDGTIRKSRARGRSNLEKCELVHGDILTTLVAAEAQRGLRNIV